MIFDYPTVEALVGHLAELVLKAPPINAPTAAAGEVPDALSAYLQGLDDLSESDVLKKFSERQ